MGSLVLAKSYEGGLWARAIILDIIQGTSTNEGTCVVKFETKALGEIEVPMQNIFPLTSNSINIFIMFINDCILFIFIFIDEELLEICNSDEESKTIERDAAIVNEVLLNTKPVQSLGSWEKHTKVVILSLFVMRVRNCILNIIC